MPTSMSKPKTPHGKHGLHHVYVFDKKLGLVKADGCLFKDPATKDEKEKSSGKPEYHWGAIFGAQKLSADLQKNIPKDLAKKIIKEGETKYKKLKAIAEQKKKEQDAEIQEHIDKEKVKEEKASGSSSSSSSSSSSGGRKSPRMSRKVMKTMKGMKK